MLLVSRSHISFSAHPSAQGALVIQRRPTHVAAFIAFLVGFASLRVHRAQYIVWVSTKLPTTEVDTFAPERRCIAGRYCTQPIDRHKTLRLRYIVDLGNNLSLRRTEIHDIPRVEIQILPGIQMFVRSSRNVVASSQLQAPETKMIRQSMNLKY